MDIKYSELISEIKENIETDSAKMILEKFLLTPPSSDTPFETLSSIIKYGFGNVFPFSYIIKASLTALAFITIINFFKDAFKSQEVWRVIKYFYTLSVMTATIIPSYKLICNSAAYMRDISTFLGIAFPALGILTASGGNLAFANSQVVFFSLFLSGVQIVLNYIVPCATAFILGITIVDAFSGEGKLVCISNFIRNGFISFFAILVSLFYISLSVFGQASKSADAVSARTLRLLIGNAIPIVGGTVAESLKFVSSGIINIKNTIGISAVVFILTLFIPILIFLWVCGIMLNLINCFSDYLNITELKSTVTNIKHLFDFSLAAFSVIVITAIININAFLSITPSYL